MLRNLASLLSSFSLLVLPLAVLMHHSDAQAGPPDPNEIAHIKFGHTKVEGVVTQIKSGLYTVRTANGTNYTLAESVAVRYGRDVPKVGDEMVLWINEGNDIMNAGKKGVRDLNPHFMYGKLVSIDYGRSQMTVIMSSGKKQFKFRPESPMFRNIAVGAPVTIAVNETGEVIDLHVDSAPDMPRSGRHPDNDRAPK